MTLVLERTPHMISSDRLETAVTWETDFSDVDAQGQVVAEPSEAVAAVQIGDIVQLTDGEHYCQAVVTARGNGYVLARPEWHTWYSPAVRISAGRSLPGPTATR